jgi:hypothetical protein
MELMRLLSNLNLAQVVHRAHKAVANMDPAPPLQMDAPPVRPRPGEIIRTIASTLAGHPEGLRTVEVRRLAEEQLGRKLPVTTVKGALAGGSGTDGRFERVARGRYRLRPEI